MKKKKRTAHRVLCAANKISWLILITSSLFFVKYYTGLEWPAANGTAAKNGRVWNVSKWSLAWATNERADGKPSTPDRRPGTAIATASIGRQRWGWFLRGEGDERDERQTQQPRTTNAVMPDNIRRSDNIRRTGSEWPPARPRTTWCRTTIRRPWSAVPKTSPSKSSLKRNDI